MSQASTAKKVPIWLDCDPGHDDAFAILMCAHHPSVAFLGISTVHGNASLEQTTNNASSVLVALGRTDVPVYPGANKPFCRHAVHAPDIHGSSGLDGTDLLPPPTRDAAQNASAMPAVTAMYQAVMACPPGTAWVVATGTLTNVALLLAIYPDVAAHLAGVSIMGGAFEDTLSSSRLGEMADGAPRPQRIGNITPWAEFNIYADPESAQAVISHPNLNGKVIVIPLDVTHTVLATKDVLKQVLHGDKGTSKLRQMMHDLLVFFANTYAEIFGLTAGPPLHDPVAVAAVLYHEGLEPSLAFAPDHEPSNLVEVAVNTSGQHGDSSQLGRTVRKDRTANLHAYVPDGLNVDAFWTCINGCLDRADKVSAMGSA